MEYNELVQILEQRSDKAYQAFNNPIVNSSVPSLGVRTPELRKLSKQLTLAQADALPLHKYLEMDMLKGMVIVAAKKPFCEKAKLLIDFAHTIENWAVCDSNTIRVPKSEQRQYFDFFFDILSSDKPFVCRYGIVNLMSSYLSEQYIDEVLAGLTQITLWGEYYVDMAAAWLLATAMAKLPEKTREYLLGEGRTTVGVFAYNKALQKMRDSFRVSPEDKQWTYTLKRCE